MDLHILESHWVIWQSVCMTLLPFPNSVILTDIYCTTKLRYIVRNCRVRNSGSRCNSAPWRASRWTATPASSSTGATDAWWASGPTRWSRRTRPWPFGRSVQFSAGSIPKNVGIGIDSESILRRNWPSSIQFTWKILSVEEIPPREVAWNSPQRGIHASFLRTICSASLKVE